jgi:hypothetical protein
LSVYCGFSEETDEKNAAADRFIDAFAKEEKMELTKTERLLSKLLKVAGVGKKQGFMQSLQQIRKIGKSK